MNELRRCQALLLAHQRLHANMRNLIKNIKSTYLVRLEETEDSLILTTKETGHNWNIGLSIVIRKNWYIKIFCKQDQNIEVGFQSPLLHNFIKEHFPAQLEKGYIIRIDLCSGFDDLIRCDYNFNSQNDWYVQIIDAHNTEIVLPIGLCLDIIVKAKQKFGLRVISEYFFN